MDITAILAVVSNMTVSELELHSLEFNSFSLEIFVVLSIRIRKQTKLNILFSILKI